MLYATMKPIPGKLYTSYDWLAAVEVIDGLCVVDMMVCVYNTPFMFLGKQIVHHPSDPFGEIANTTSTAAKCLVGERIAFFASRKEVTRRDVYYKIPAFEEWDMKLGEEK